jgi:Holliday junction DNA helicase RuvA
MIAFLRGQLVEKDPARVLLDVQGVGYEVFIPLSSYDRLPAEGDSCRLLTYHHIREDAHQLFGFVSEAERDMFTLLLGVNGIGPKLALSALSGLSVRELRAALAEGDTKRLSSISGVGRKLAERMVVELRDKIPAGEALEAVTGEKHAAGAHDVRLRDAVLALIELGYKQEAARKMVSAVLLKPDASGLTVQDIIKHALGA